MTTAATPPASRPASAAMTATPKMSLDEMKRLCNRMRIAIIKMIGAAGSGHPGGSLSEVEMLAALYFQVMRHDPGNPSWPDRDRFILSKGHGCPALYAAMAEAGYIDPGTLNTLRKLGSPLQGHPDKRMMPVLEASTGSLGQGLSIGVGIALAGRLDKLDYHTFVMTGDGETQEGQNWEAAMFAAYHKLNNLTLIVDDNHMQLDGFTADILDLAPLGDKFRSFGWHTLEIDGNKLEEVIPALQEARAGQGDKPCCIISNTIKGKGVSFMENKAEWHGSAPKPDQVALAVKELEANFAS